MKRLLAIASVTAGFCGFAPPLPAETYFLWDETRVIDDASLGNDIIFLGGASHFTFEAGAEFGGEIILMGESVVEVRGGIWSPDALIWLNPSTTAIFAGCDLEETLLPTSDFFLTHVVTGVLADGMAVNVTVMTVPSGYSLLFEDVCPQTSSVDTDGDGVDDPLDQCPDSDLRETIWIESLDTGVANLLADERAVDEFGCSPADYIQALVETARQESRNHGQLVRTVSQSLKQLERNGLIPPHRHGTLVSCVARLR